MRLPLSLAALALLAGCSAVSTVREAWDWDPSAMQDRTRVTLSGDQLGALTNRVAELQIQRNGIRSRISAEPDIRVRQRLYADLHGLERQLAAVAPAR